MSLKPWYVYMVRCARGAIYTGISVNVKKRVREHNYGCGAKAVRALGLPVTLVFKSVKMDQSQALKAEAQIKRLNKKKKEELIQNSVYWKKRNREVNRLLSKE